MLQFDRSKQTVNQSVTPPEIATPQELYKSFVAFVRRRHPVIVAVMLFSLGLATLYIQTTPPRYTGEAVLLIDSHRLDLFQQQHPMGEDEPIDTAIVDSQVEILKSEEIALNVIKELNLTSDPEFVGPSSGTPWCCVQCHIQRLRRLFRVRTELEVRDYSRGAGTLREAAGS